MALKTSKLTLSRRLAAEGRLDEAMAYKDAMIRELRKQFPNAGMGASVEVKERAWEMMEEKYPPLAGFEQYEKTCVKPKKGTVLGVKRPEDWGELPDSAELGVEVDWVHQNRSLVVEEMSSGAVKLNWDKARTAAPSYGAVNLMEFAATNRKGFMDLLVRVKPGTGVEEEGVKREKTRVEEMRKILEQFKEARAK